MNDHDAKPDLLEHVSEAIERQSLLEEGERVLLAVSGGADSMSLLSILRRLSSRFRIELAIGHFDHRLRDTSNVDRRTVEVIAGGLGLAFHHGEGDVHARAEEHGETIEEAARKLRYQYLFDLANEIRADRIATGHTRDDQIETVLMRILRGTGTRGLAGIPARRGSLIRPLLGLAHLQLVNYCRENHIPFVEDPLNRDKRFTRNWLRFELLPSIRRYYPSVGDNLLRLSRNAADALQRIRRSTTPFIKRNLRCEERGAGSAELADDADYVWTLDLAGIGDLDQEDKYVLFGDLLTDHLGYDPDYSRVHFEKLTRLSGRAAASGEQLSIPGLTVRREFDTLVFTPPGRPAGGAPSPKPVVELAIPGEVSVGAVRVRASIHTSEPDDSAEDFDAAKFLSHEPMMFESGGNRKPGVAYFALPAVQPPLVIRSPRAGDRMRPFGMKGRKKLSDIFIDRKIPLRRRDETLVVADRNQILWLVGVTTAESARISVETENILKISVNPE